MALRGDGADVVRRLAPVLDRMAAEAAPLLYGPDGMPWGTPFEELEDDAFELGQALARRLLRELVADQAEEPVPEEFACCPTCGGPPERTPEDLAEDEDDEDLWNERRLKSRSGEVPWHEPRRKCPSCRRAFSPSVEGAGDRPREPQPGSAAAGGVRGSEGGVRPGE